MSLPVLNDAQMGMFQVIHPHPDFEAMYQGAAGSVPIAFPGTLDPDAGRTGYDPNLLEGISTPLGGRVHLQIPMTVDLYTPQDNYQYQLVWRVRNLDASNQDLSSGRRNSAAYHLPNDGDGRAEFLINDPRVFIPGASDIEIFEQGEPGSGAALLNITQQRYVPKITAPWTQPILPGNKRGIWQQGVYQFSSNENCSGPTYSPLWLDACGDELLILVYKVETEVNWDFAGVDKAFSNTYGTNNGTLPINEAVGILLSCGSQGS